MSRAGQITLVKSVLNNILIINVQLEMLSTRIHKELDEAIKDVCTGRGGGKHKRRIRLMNWKILCKPKEMGGAGLKMAKVMNRALLAKLDWWVMAQG